MSNLLDTGGRRLGSIFVPLILIGLGSLLLLQSAGLVQVSIWDLVGRLWPLIPLLVGIELLIGQRSPRTAVLVMLLVSSGVIAATALVASGPVDSGPGDFPVSWGLGSTKQATVSGGSHRIEELLAMWSALRSSCALARVSCVCRACLRTAPYSSPGASRPRRGR